jgi:hypothetical protein
VSVLLGQTLAGHALLGKPLSIRVDADLTVALRVLTHKLCAPQSTLLASTNPLHGARDPHGDDRRSVIPGVLEPPLER